MRQAIVVCLLTLLLFGCDEIASPPSSSSASPSSGSDETAAFRRAREIVGLFLKDDVTYSFKKSHEYENSNGGTTVKGSCAADGRSYEWTIAFDSSGTVTAFSFDTVTFLAKQPAGHLSFLPENKKYVTNDVVVMPSIEDLWEAGVDAKKGY